MNKIRNYTIPFLAILGIFIAIKLIFVYFNANFASISKASFCTINDVIDCDGVAKTSFSRFLGVPLALYGMGYYIVVLFLSLIDNKLTTSNFLSTIIKKPKDYIFTISTIALTISLILAYISSHVIHKVCILCYVTYVLNGLILIASKPKSVFTTAYKNTFSDFFDALKRPLLSTFIAIAFLFSGTCLFLINKYDIFNPVGNFYSQKTTSIKTKNVSGGTYLGSQNPDIIIHEYTDFLCPYCGMSNEMLNQLVLEFKNVAVIHHDYPLDGKCNSDIKKSAHENSCLISQFSKAAKKQNKYWGFNNLVFENNYKIAQIKDEQMVIKELTGYAKMLELDLNKLKEDAFSETTKETVKTEVKKARKKNVTVTPTYIIGIKKYEGLMPYYQLKSIVLSAGGKLK